MQVVYQVGRLQQSRRDCWRISTTRSDLRAQGAAGNITRTLLQIYCRI